MFGNITVVNKKHIFSRLLCTCIAAALFISSCASAGTAGSAPPTDAISASPETGTTAGAPADPSAVPEVSADPNATPETVDLSKYSDVPLPQLDPVKDGEEIAVLHTDMGNIKMRFFPEYTPNAVQNFKTLAKSNYYDNNIFYRVLKNEFIQTGDPTGTGTGGQSMWGGPFAAETTPCLHNIYGAVSMMRGQDSNSQGSQFLIVANRKLDDAAKKEIESYKDKQDQVIGTTADGVKVPYAQVYPNKIIDKYLEGGGFPGLDMQFTVFAQVFDGFDVIDKIASVQTSQEETTKEKPLTDIKINSITFEAYKA